jgi:hypothetical protein
MQVCALTIFFGVFINQNELNINYRWLFYILIIIVNGVFLIMMGKLMLDEMWKKFGLIINNAKVILNKFPCMSMIIRVEAKEG